MKVNLINFPFRGLIAASALGAALLFAGASPARADNDCQRRIAQADRKLHQAVDHHGWNSPQAAKYRSQLASARSSCWEHGHRWWNEDDRTWHTDRNWDDHDHDHDHDRDHDNH